MLGLSALQLARIQFGFTISAHIIFPAITIGLASYLVVLEALWLWKKARVYRDLYQFWSGIFAVNFGMGVVSGLVMAYQFGTNWSHFSAFAGSITGPLLAYEVMTAFFLEAGFLGVMLFGWSRVGPGLHFFLGYTGLLISIWPQIVPPTISIWEAAAPPQSMGFTLVGALFVIPFILAYTAWSYYVFRGKVRAGEGYH